MNMDLEQRQLILLQYRLIFLFWEIRYCQSRSRVSAYSRDRNPKLFSNAQLRLPTTNHTMTSELLQSSFPPTCISMFKNIICKLFRTQVPGMRHYLSFYALQISASTSNGRWSLQNIDPKSPISLCCGSTVANTLEDCERDEIACHPDRPGPNSYCPQPSVLSQSGTNYRHLNGSKRGLKAEIRTTLSDFQKRQRFACFKCPYWSLKYCVSEDPRERRQLSELVAWWPLSGVAWKRRRSRLQPPSATKIFSNSLEPFALQ